MDDPRAPLRDAYSLAFVAGLIAGCLWPLVLVAALLFGLAALKAKVSGEDEHAALR